MCGLGFLTQVEMYFPESGHPAFGIFRAVVKDSTDIDHGAASQVRSSMQSGLRAI